MPESVNGQEAVSLEQLKTLNDSYADRFIPYASSSAIANANDWLTTGYAKTSTSTTNLPAECTGTSMWGVLLFVAENAEMGTGTQQFFPIDGDMRGHVFSRSLTRMAPGQDFPIIGDWQRIATVDDIPELPTGGTDGQVLTSDGTGGAAWESVPQPDLTGVVKAEGTSFLGTKKLTVNGEDIRLLSVRTTSSDHTQGSEFYVGSKDGCVQIASSPYDDDASVESQSSVGITGKDGTNYLLLSVAGNKARFSLNKKTVQNIVDLIQESPVGNNLVTDKAVVDYVAANAGGGGGLQLLWEGSSSSIVSVSGYTLTDYDFILIVFLTGGAYYVSACRPDGNTYMAHTTQTTVNISGSYANSVSVASPAVIRAIYGIKASEQ